MARILMDTNILILREDIQKVPNEVQELLKILNQTNYKIVIHPFSIEEIRKDKDFKRRDIVLSKIETYETLEKPPLPEKGSEFIELLGEAKNDHDKVDNALLYCVYTDIVSFLITEDKQIQKKAIKLKISDRVFNSQEALQFFNKQINVDYLSPLPLKYVPVHVLDLNDQIFDSLRKDYHEFDDWWKKIRKEGRKAWVHYVDEKIGAILILKDEEEPINSIPPLPKKRRLKISTLKVDHIDNGLKIGELFIKLSIQTALQKNINEIYLTHFTKENDPLVTLIEEYGFFKAAEILDEKNPKKYEDVFIKHLIPDKENKYKPEEIYKKFYPSFYDGKEVNKLIVPIKPKWHQRLFTDYKNRQITLEEAAGNFIVEGNTIKKAYLCHSKTKNIKEGDILLFYRSEDTKGITTLGIVEKVYDNVVDPDKIISYVGKRSVYSEAEIHEIAKKPTKIILFWWIMHFEKSITLKSLIAKKILKAPPQSITKISHDKYLKIKEVVKINDCYTIS